MKKILAVILLSLIFAGCATSKEQLAYNCYYRVIKDYPNVGCFQKSQILYSKLRKAGFSKEKVDIVYGEYSKRLHFWVECDGRLYDPSIQKTNSGFPKEEYKNYKAILKFKGNF